MKCKACRYYNAPEDIRRKTCSKCEKRSWIKTGTWGLLVVILLVLILLLCGCCLIVWRDIASPQGAPPDRSQRSNRPATAIAATVAPIATQSLVSPKGDGFYTVGDEIAPGRWESTGSDDRCYWERLDEYQDILDNHFGQAGGTVTILSTDHEVHFKNCGTWEYMGP